MELAFWVGDHRGDSPTVRFFSSGLSGQLKLFQVVDLLAGVREEEWRTGKVASQLPVSPGSFG